MRKINKLKDSIMKRVRDSSFTHNNIESVSVVVVEQAILDVLREEKRKASRVFNYWDEEIE